MKINEVLLSFVVTWVAMKDIRAHKLGILHAPAFAWKLIQLRIKGGIVVTIDRRLFWVP